MSELPNGRVVCGCSHHSWPNQATYLESCRRASLTMSRIVHDWTQSH
ncbi:MAG TPA: hypothetical protein VL123_07780 [Candidatus Udaeobacter sp.]|nr:hypothetical protein [Candidatus Udaeobacter sp.]